MNIITNWLKTYLSNPQVLIFIFLLAGAALVLMTIGKILTPLIASLVIAYLLEGLIRWLEKLKLPRLPAFLLVFSIFLLGLFFLLLGLIPLLSKQIAQFVQDLPNMISSWEDQLKHLPQKYPQLISENQINNIMETLGNQLGKLGDKFLSISLASVRGLVDIIVYIVLVPLMVFFLLKDKQTIISYLQTFLPQDISLTSQIWREVNHKTAKFIQGKMLEILIVWGISYAAFLFLSLKFALLLSFLVGLSVIVPYVGATLMTIPVALVAYFQWGWDPQFFYTLITYLIIQILDGNVLVPILLSGIVNLHPLAIIIGILVFGGLWGFWGVFFAIPLATLVHAIIKAWPREAIKKEETSNN